MEIFAKSVMLHPTFHDFLLSICKAGAENNFQFLDSMFITGTIVDSLSHNIFGEEEEDEFDKRLTISWIKWCWIILSHVIILFCVNCEPIN